MLQGHVDRNMPIGINRHYLLEYIGMRDFFNLQKNGAVLAIIFFIVLGVAIGLVAYWQLSE